MLFLKAKIISFRFSLRFCLLLFVMCLKMDFQAYVQQLELSRIKLTQLEQELQRARTQVIIYLYICEGFEGV